jgi:adenine-specific DNA-methyltransferase
LARLSEGRRGEDTVVKSSKAWRILAANNFVQRLCLETPFPLIPLSTPLTHSTALAPTFDVAALGQVFTPPAVVEAMRALVRNRGRVLEPSCGDGAFFQHFPGSVGIEIDARHAPPGARVMDFFALPETETFATIIGNPPYVRYQDIAQQTRLLTRHSPLDGRANLYLFFIEKCLRHLEPGGELIFITPRDFLKATSAIPLNRALYGAGTITDFIDLGDTKLFDGATPNCAIWRFVHGDFSRRTRYASVGTADGSAGLRKLTVAWADKQAGEARHFVESGGHLLLTQGDYALHLADIAFVKVGAVSGADALYASAKHGQRNFVCSATVSTGETRRMIWCEPGDPPPAALLPHKARLIARRIRPFDESNWWLWGRGYHQSPRPRVYVNCKTRRAQPFFVHRCTHYDGAVMAIFPRDPTVDVQALANALNAVDWADLGFVCDGRFLFTQRSLEQAPLPECFQSFVPSPVS